MGLTIVEWVRSLQGSASDVCLRRCSRASTLDRKVIYVWGVMREYGAFCRRGGRGGGEFGGKLWWFQTHVLPHWFLDDVWITRHQANATNAGAFALSNYSGINISYRNRERENDGELERGDARPRRTTSQLCDPSLVSFLLRDLLREVSGGCGIGE